MSGVTFVIAGDDRRHRRYARSIMKQAQAENVDALFRVVGHVADMPAAYAASDIVVVPCIAPPIYGQVVAEAQAMARPVIASAIGPIPGKPWWCRRACRTTCAPAGWCSRATPIEIARALATALALDATAYRALAARARQFAEFMFAPGRDRRRDARGLYLAAGSRAVVAPAVRKRASTTARDGLSDERHHGRRRHARQRRAAAVRHDRIDAVARPLTVLDRRADAACRRGRRRRRRAGPHSRGGRPPADRRLARRPLGRATSSRPAANSCCSTSPARTPRSCCATRSRLTRLVRERRCDVVHAHGRAAAWSAFACAKLHRRAVPDHLVQGLPRAERASSGSTTA